MSTLRKDNQCCQFDYKGGARPDDATAPEISSNSQISAIVERTKNRKLSLAKRKILLLLALIFCTTLMLPAQRSSGIAVQGKVSVQQGSVEGAIIQMYRDGRRLDDYGIGSDGRYKVELPYNHKYELVFVRKDNFPLKIAVDANVPADILQRELVFPPFPLDVNLFTEIPGIDRSFTNNTILRIFYSPQVGNFISEIYYNDAQIAKLIEQAKLQAEALGRESDYLSKLTRAELAELRKEYNQLLEQAGKEYSEEKFVAALDGFKAASKIFPNEQFPKDRIAEINDLLGLMMVEADLNKAKSERFAALIKEADNFFARNQFQEARNSYNRALSINPDDNYALGQVSKINDILRKRQLEQQYADLVAQADVAFNQLLYAEARAKYEEALSLKSGENYPKTKIQEIEQLLAKQEKEIRKQESYKEAMFQGDAMFEKQFYDKAIASYENALNFVPDDPAATAKITKVKAIMKEIADRMLFEELVKEADKLFKKEQLQEALTSYSKAADLFPDDKKVAERIGEINRILNLQENFADLVYKADNQFIAGNYQMSKDLYVKALVIHPDDKHSNDRVNEINAILEQQQIDALYNSVIAQADELLNGNNLEPAKNKYNEALKLKPKEKYPQDKIREIDAQLQAITRTNQQYQQIIAGAESLFSRNEYEKAKTEFARAGALKPDESYPSEMIVKIDNIIAEQKRLAEEAEAEKARLAAEAAAAEAARLAAIQAEKDKNYADAVARADNLFNQKDYENARTEYQSALKIKPEENYPQQRIDEIGTLLAQRAAAQKAYDEAVARADREFNRESWEAAIAAYNQAKQAKADETYPDEQLAKIDSIVTTRERIAAEAAAAEAARLAAIQAEKDKNYADAVARADNLFNQKEYENARTEYQSALKIKPEENYPQQRIEEIGTLLAQRAAAQKAYDEAVVRADREFNRESWEAAIAAYNEAKQAKAEETYPDKQLAKIDSIVTTRERIAAEAAAAEAARLAAIQSEKDKNYNDAVARADNLFNQKEYENARTEYQSALKIKPEENYPQQRIEEIGTLLAQRAAAQKAYDEAVARADREFNRESWEAAIAAYNEAKQAKADETYPDEQLAKIDSIVTTRERIAAEAAAADAARLEAIQAEKDKNYNDAVARADNLFNQKDYENSKVEYEAAMKIKPEEIYPQQRIEEIGTLLAQIEAERKAAELRDKNYAELIQQADRLFAAKNFVPSKEKYTDALNLKPDEKYPANQLAEIEKLLQQQETDEQYRTILVAADGLFKTGKYRESKSEYEKALTLKPDENYPKNQIAKIDNILEAETRRLRAEQEAAENLQRRTEAIAQRNLELENQNVESEAELNNLYNDYIRQADGYFDAKQYNISRGWYYKAWDVKPGETYPQQRIAEINRLVGSLLSNQRDRDFQRFIDMADSTFRENQFAVARGWYNRALGIKANEQYPKDQLAEIERIIAERLAGQSGQQFENHVQKAEKAFNEKNYGVARFWYKKALELRPDNAEIKNRLEEIAKALR